MTTTATVEPTSPLPPSEVTAETRLLTAMLEEMRSGTRSLPSGLRKLLKHNELTVGLGSNGIQTIQLDIAIDDEAVTFVFRWIDEPPGAPMRGRPNWEQPRTYEIKRHRASVSVPFERRDSTAEDR